VRSLLLRPEVRRRMGVAGAQRVGRRYTWQQVAAETETVYGRLLSDAPSDESAPEVIDLREPVTAPVLDSREVNGREEI
jgi:hypothetical protein